MREPDPTKRLTIKQVVDQYDMLLKSRWWWQLRAPVFIKRHDEMFDDVVLGRLRWLKHTIRHVLTLKKALPKPTG